MQARPTTWETIVLEQLLRRLRIVVEHHRYRGQPVEARDLVALVLAEHERRHREQLVQYRAALEDAVRALLFDSR